MGRELKIVKNDDTDKYELELSGEFDEMRTIAKYAIEKRPNSFGVLEEIYKSNLNREFTELIQNAGRFCECHASDVLFGIENIKRDLDDPFNFIDIYGEQEEKESEKTYMFGFRREGVDYKSTIQYKVKMRNYEAYSYYRSIYEFKIRMRTEKDGDDRYLVIEVGFQRVL